MRTSEALRAMGPERLRSLGLEGYRALDLELTEKEESALAWLKLHAPWAARSIALETKKIVWLEACEQGVSPFASATFFEDLGTTYLTKLANHYVPPSTVLRVASPYPLAENLYHEATHQELYRLAEAGLILKKEARGGVGPQIFVPWRKTNWSLEHAFHALVVYKRVKRLREIALSLEDLGIGAADIRGAAEAIRVLTEGISAHRGFFQGPAWEFLS